MSDILWQDGDPDDIWRALTAADQMVVTQPSAPDGYYDEYVSFHVLLNYANDRPGTYKYEYVHFSITAD